MAIAYKKSCCKKVLKKTAKKLPNSTIKLPLYEGNSRMF